MQIELKILGEPKAQKRHRSVKMGNFNRQYDPSSADKKDFLSIVQDNAPLEPFVAPLSVNMVFVFTRPKSHYRSGKNSHILKDDAPIYHVSKPDCDNLAKFVMDALNKIYWKDDSLICSISVTKKYTNISFDPSPMTRITISKL